MKEPLMTLEEARKNAQGWKDQLAEAETTLAVAPSNSPARSMAWRKKVNAKMALEWYEGYWTIPPNVHKEIIARERLAMTKGEYEIFDEKKIDRELWEFHPGMIQILASEASRLQKASNLGARFMNRTFASFDAKKNPSAFTKASAYANSETLFEDSRNCLLFIGSTGTGKTHLAAAIANRLVEIGVPTMFGTFQSHLDKIKSEFDTSGERHYLDDIRGVPMLVLDDLGKERQTDWTRSILYDVVNYRYEHLLPIIFTTNLGVDDLANYCGGAVWSRLSEMCDTVQMNGEDFRTR